MVSGVPVVRGAADAVQSSIFLLLAAVLVMAATLALVFRTRLRLLPLGLALAAAAVTFGALSLAGGSLTMASIAVLPVLIGLRWTTRSSSRPASTSSARPGAGGAPARAVVEDAAAAAAAAVPRSSRRVPRRRWGFLVLLLSPVPMVRGFGLLLVLGIGVALACASWPASPCWCASEDARSRAAAAAGERPAGIRAHPRLEAARERLADHSWRALGVALARREGARGGPAVAVLGLALDTQSEVVSDVQQLVPQDLQALRDVDSSSATGVRARSTWPCGPTTSPGPRCCAG